VTDAAGSPQSRNVDCAYYQLLHDTSSKYQANNWLIEDLPVLRGIHADSVLEMGCGNGLFLARACEHWPDVSGLDWVRSAVLERVLEEHPTIRFLEQDVAEFRAERSYDLLVSADFLEHIAPAALPDLIRTVDACAHVNYHRIACYDDGHTHLTIRTANRWLRTFRHARPDGGYRIVGRSYRGKRRRKAVVVISNMGHR
jgi:cyclopropane fatty-acyl-phospholipid synthase-like methyltransferase